MSYVRRPRSLFRKARRSFETLEIRLAPSETLLSLAAASFVDPRPVNLKTPDRNETRYEVAPRDTTNIVIAPADEPEKTNTRIVPPVSAEASDAVHSEFVDLASEITIGEAPVLAEPAKAVPVSSIPSNLNNPGVSSSPAPGGAAAPGGGGGGGGGTHDAAAAAGAQQLAPPPHSAGTMAPLDYTPPPPTADDSSNLGYHDSPINGQVTGEGGTGAYSFSVASGPSDGTVALNSDGTYTYTPTAGTWGTDSFTFNVTDTGTGEMSLTPGTVTLTIGETAPQVMDDEYTMYHDQSIDVMPGVLANDNDAESDPMTAILDQGPSHARGFAFNSDGTFSYIPDVGYVGDDTFTYKASDGLLTSTDATVTIHVTDSKPIANDDGWLANPVNQFWEVNWNKLDSDNYSVTQNVLANDQDAESDTLVPSIITPPSDGTFTMETDPFTGEWTGQFTFKPDVGFGGWVTFTYKVNDGALDSDPATAKILVQKIDLDLADGQNGNVVADDKEDSRGAYTVTNSINDTDGDTFIDAGQHPVIASARGRNEVDLMKLVINQPVPLSDPNADVSVTVYNNTDNTTGRIWDDAVKHNELDDGYGSYSIRAGDIPAGGKIVYVELPEASPSLRNYEIQGFYNSAGWDSVFATAVSASVSAIEYGQKSGAAIAQEFPDMDQDLKNWISDWGGTGLQGPFTNGANNNGNGTGIGQGVVIQYTISPPRAQSDGTWESNGVYFDAARQKQQYLWQQVTPGDPISPVPAGSIAFPTQVEAPNDDRNESDESNAVTSQGHFYAYDRPGYTTANALVNDLIERQNFKDFLRVGFGTNPSGNTVAGSRCSPYKLWNAYLDIIPDANGLWQENPNGITRIAEQNVDLTNPDPTQ